MRPYAAALYQRPLRPYILTPLPLMGLYRRAPG
eukprot:COSAG02_NODE_68133_length_251_cov_0.684211_1_plen_32_part_01